MKQSCLKPKAQWGGKTSDCSGTISLLLLFLWHDPYRQIILYAVCVTYWKPLWYFVSTLLRCNGFYALALIEEKVVFKTQQSCLRISSKRTVKLVKMYLTLKLRTFICFICLTGTIFSMVIHDYKYHRVKEMNDKISLDREQFLYRTLSTIQCVLRCALIPTCESVFHFKSSCKGYSVFA